MFDGFQQHTITTQQDPKVDMCVLASGDSTTSPNLPALLLLHGFPQTRHIWHRVAPQLTSKYTVVIVDLRGYGESSKPEGIGQYAKSAMAADMAAIMSHLGFDTFFVCGHDRGGRVAHKLAVDYPARVRKLIVLDICPTLAMYESTDMAFATAYYHWFFLIQPAPLPETLISAAPRAYIETSLAMRNRESLSIFDKRCFEHYCRGLEDPAGVHAMCNDYRASATLDLDEARADLAAGRRIRCQVRAIWGRRGIIGRFDAVQEWRNVTDEGVSVDGYDVDSGHYIPEEAPDDVVAAINEVFVGEA